MTSAAIESRQDISLPTEVDDYDKNAEDDCLINSDYNNKKKELHKSGKKSCKYKFPPKITRSPAAFPFFPKGSVVIDWYRGEISSAIELARSSDIAFVMFYAPWDAESQTVRHEFELTARYMGKQIFFAAVNCWQPGSECRNQNNKVYNWPVLIAYPAHGRGIQYNGPNTAPHMMRFLNAVCRPLLRINNKSDIDILLASHGAVIVGHVNSLPGSLNYNILYSTALRFLEKDPFQDIAFAVQTEPKTGQTLPFLQLYLWNETWSYSKQNEWKPETILNWIVKKLHEATIWVSSTGMKSQSLSVYVQPGPTLILFTPKNPLLPNVDYYDLLREAALEYKNCDNKKSITTLHSRLIHNRRMNNYNKYKNLLKTCSIEPKLYFPTVVTYATPTKWLNNSCQKSTSCNEFKYNENTLPEKCKNNNEDCLKMYPTLLQKHDVDNTVCISKEVSNKMNDLYKTSQLDDANDPKSPRNLKKLLIHEKCRLVLVAQKYEPAKFAPAIKDPSKIKNKPLNITGLACKTNTSLTMIAMDSLKHYPFAERLGIDILQVKEKTAVVIINDKMESHYIMNQPLSDSNLRQFIYNFTYGVLNRALNSTVQSRYVHKYSTLEDCCLKQRIHFCVSELNGDNFLTTVLEPDKAVVVLYYSKQCSFCQGVSYKYLMAAKAFRSVPNLQFTRVDGDLNTLPWEYTMENYPTILYFPARRKSESRAFPRNIPVTVQHLITFVLVNLDFNTKLQAMWSLCNQTKFDSEKQVCITSLRIETLQLINNTLQEWRKSDVRKKTKILYKLQKLKTLHLLLAHKSQNINDIQNQINKLQHTNRLKSNIKDEL